MSTVTAHKLIVEVSNPYHSDGNAYERWQLSDAKALADRLESELDWTPRDCEDAAEGILEGEDFEHEDTETGRTVRAWRVES